MRYGKWIAGFLGLIVGGAVAGTSLAQQGVAEKAGETLDGVGRGIKKGAVEIGDAVRRRFEGVRGEVSRMGVHNRVYSRLHWDRALNTSKIEVHLLKGGEVLLRGYVPDEEAHQRAITLTRDTVDVAGVVDELVPLVKPAQTPAPTSSIVVPKAR
ncbi:MAG: BON domain-containing protein [Isosphaeraceae bacterium]|nr:BON domain-containing protein [Isosphaeraceae bacterium]